MLAAGPGLQTEALKRLVGRPAPDRQVPPPHKGPSQQYLMKALVRWPCPDCSTPYVSFLVHCLPYRQRA